MSSPRRGHVRFSDTLTGKIVWDIVCMPIEEGGLNIKNLEIQNICLLLKFIHMLH
jgi:hypothetical protein